MKNLGRHAEDKVTGFKGTITGVTTYLYGSTLYEITSPDIGGGKVREGWFHEGRVKIFEDGENAGSGQV
ncbi:MAG: hypothetical protein KAR19_03590 [Bacteroidales bacterium]|nr:hypothetical protein [Bacteroidales bacterium]